MLSRSSSAPQVLLVTSSNAGEGKSTVSLNLATVLAQQGVRVLLVDADLRRPVLHERMGVHAQEGLSAALSSDHIDPQPLRSKAFRIFKCCVEGRFRHSPQSCWGRRECAHSWGNGGVSMTSS